MNQSLDSHRMLMEWVSITTVSIEMLSARCANTPPIGPTAKKKPSDDRASLKLCRRDAKYLARCAITRSRSEQKFMFLMPSA